MTTLPDLTALLEAHSLSKKLHAEDPDIISANAVLDIPEHDRADTFTTGTCEAFFLKPPAVLASRKARAMVAALYLGPKAMGHPGFVHGGVLATIMDECCGRAALCHFQAQKMAHGETIQKSAAVTAQLSLTFIAPVPTSTSVIVHAAAEDDPTEGSSARKVNITARLWRLVEGEKDVLCAEAKSMFIEPKQASKP